MSKQYVKNVTSCQGKDNKNNTGENTIKKTSILYSLIYDKINYDALITCPKNMEETIMLF